MRPLIGVSCNWMPAEPGRHLYPNKDLQYGEGGLVRAVAAAGALPLLVPHLEPQLDAEALAAELVARLDGVIIAGGTDVDPSFYGEDLKNERWRGQPERDRLEIALIREALRQQRPVLGLCRGHQILNVALGGTLYQDIATLRPGSLQHRDQEQYDKLGHALQVLPGTRLAEIVGAGEHWINSVHHQAIKDLAPGLRASAHAPDGVIEAVEGEGCLGCQFHPEWMQETSLGRAIFADFLRRVAAR